MTCEASYQKTIEIIERAEALCGGDDADIAEMLFVLAAAYITICHYQGFPKEISLEGAANVYDWLARYTRQLEEQDRVSTN